MDFSIELYNTDGDTSKDYLSVIYMCFLGLWVLICLKNHAYVHKIHLLMGALPVVVTLDMICGPADKRCVKLTTNNGDGDGDGHEWDHIVFYTFKFMRVVIFYSVIVLISGGWSFFRPFLPVTQKTVYMIVILLDVVSVATRDSNPFQKDRRIWERELLFIPLIISVFTLFIPFWTTISWSDRTAMANRKAATSFDKRKLKLFLFLSAVFVYLFTVWQVKVNAIVSYEESMPNTYFTEEILSLVFCMVMFYMFRPAVYFFVDVEEDEIKVSEMAKRKKNKNRRKKNPGQVSFTYPKLPEDFEW